MTSGGNNFNYFLRISVTFNHCFCSVLSNKKFTFLNGGGGLNPPNPPSGYATAIRITVRIRESEVRNPDSLDYRKSCQRILMTFYGEMGCGLQTKWLHFGDYPPHYCDPGVRSGSRSGSRKNCHVVNTHRTDALLAG